MSKHRDDLTKGSVLPSTWVNALMEFVSTVDSNFVLEVATSGATTGSPPSSIPDQLRARAAAGNGQACIGIEGRWRWNTAPVVTAHPGGPPGDYDAYVTASDNDFSLADPADATNYRFGLVLVASGALPTTELSRRVGIAYWDGEMITDLVQLVGSPGSVVPIGVSVPYSGYGDPIDPRFLLADGRLVDIPAYPAFFGAAGHQYNNGAAPGSNKVRLPDKRGRVSVGAQDMLGLRRAGTPAAPASTIPNSSRLLGRTGGEERHTLIAAESGVNGNGSTTNSGVHSHQIQGVGVDPGGGGVQWNTANALASYFQSTDTYSNPSAHGHPLSARNADNPHYNMQPYQIDNWVVRVA